MEWWRLKAVLNAVNGSTLVGLGIARVGQARVRRGPRGLLLATGYRLGFPHASAFTVGNVVLTRHDPAWWESRPRLLVHEERHSWQYVVLLGLPMLPLYGAAAAWSYLRGGDPATHNLFETRAGLEDGGYPTVSRRQRRRSRTA
ncbi:MAG TPA: hypothetical protein VFZ64_12670 [Nocardioidaceae bacterium]